MPKSTEATFSFMVPAPFDAESQGDCILRSSDGFDFKAWRVILCTASTVFRDMFSIPSAPTPSTHCREESTHPIIVLHEDAQTLQLMLQMLYPVDPPTLTSPFLISKLVIAFDKYFISMAKLRLHARNVLGSSNALKSDPLTCFAVSWRLGLLDEAAQASRYTHHLDLSSLKVTSQILSLSGDGMALSALWDLRVRRADQLDDLLEVVKLNPSIRCAVSSHTEYIKCKLADNRARRMQLKEILGSPYPMFDDIEFDLGFRLQGGSNGTSGRSCTCIEAREAHLTLIRTEALGALDSYPQEITRQ